MQLKNTLFTLKILHKEFNIRDCREEQFIPNMNLDCCMYVPAVLQKVLKILMQNTIFLGSTLRHPIAGSKVDTETTKVGEHIS